MGAFGRRGLFVVFVVVCVAMLLTSVGVARLAHEGDDKVAVVRVTETGFEPRAVEVEAGGTVVFENVGREAHWPASDDHPTHTRYPAFDPQKPLQPGEDWSFTFKKPGEWGYHDHASPSLSGEVVARPATSNGGREGPIFWHPDGTSRPTSTGRRSRPSRTGEGPATGRAETNLGGDGEQPEEGFEEKKDVYLALVRDQDPRLLWLG